MTLLWEKLFQLNFKNNKVRANIVALTTINKIFGVSFLILDPPHQLDLADLDVGSCYFTFYFLN